MKKANKLTTYTKTELDQSLSDKLSQLTAGDPANPLPAPIATSFPILTRKPFIKGLAVQPPVTISNTGGSTYLLLSIVTSSISSKAAASDVYTNNEINNALNDLSNLFFRLTLLLSCAMHFENYPHDEQICRLSMESREYFLRQMTSYFAFLQHVKKVPSCHL